MWFLGGLGPVGLSDDDLRAIGYADMNELLQKNNTEGVGIPSPS